MTAPLLFIPGNGKLSDIPALSGLEQVDDAPWRAVGCVSTGAVRITGRKYYCADEARTASWPALGAEVDLSSPGWVPGPLAHFWLRADDVQPAELLRGAAPRYAGYTAELGGRSWVIPNGPRLPTRYGYDPHTGDLRLHVEPVHQAVADDCLQALEYARELVRVDADVGPDNAPRLIEHVGRMLSLNYRLTPVLAVMLGLFSPESLWRAFVLTTDVDAVTALFDELQKKAAVSAPNGSGTASGSGG